MSATSIKSSTLKAALLLSAAYLGSSVPALASSFEVLHWWTEQGELESKKTLANALKVSNIDLEDFAIVGGGGDGALHVLQMRALSGNPPEAAQIKGPDITEWDKLSMLVNINDVIDTTNWPAIFPQEVLDDISVNQQYMGIPINIHRVNWLWLNTKIFKQYNLQAPQTWDQFFSIADYLAAQGVNPIVLGGTSWQDALLFESVAISQLGPNKYIQAFVDFDNQVINSEEMVNTFKLFKKLHRYVRTEQQGQDWPWASQVFINDQAAMLFMGDWVKGSWTVAGKTALKDYICVPAPETQGVYSYNIDSFVVFKKVTTEAQLSNQKTFAKTLTSPEFQHDFNLLKGSIPARSDVSLAGFDQCSVRSATDFKEDSKVPSFTQNMATNSYQQREIIQLISHYFNSDTMRAEEAVQQLSVLIKALTSK